MEISRTLDSFIKAVMQQLGLKLCFYYDFKLISTCPVLKEHVNHAETIGMCKLSENSHIVLTGKHAFCFEGIPPKYTDRFFVSDNNMIVTALQNHKPEQTEEKEEEKEKQTESDKAEEDNHLELGCTWFVNEGDTVFSSGKHYWEFVIHTLPTDKDELAVGVREEDGNVSWMFYPLNRKVEVRSLEKCEVMKEEEESWQFRKGDRIGLLLCQDRWKKGSLKLFRNGGETGDELSGIVGRVRPWLMLGNGEIGLDSKV